MVTFSTIDDPIVAPSFDCGKTYRLGDRVLYKGRCLVMGPMGFHEAPYGPIVDLPTKRFP